MTEQRKKPYLMPRFTKRTKDVCRWSQEPLKRLPPRALVEELPMDRAEEESLSNTKVTSGVTEN
ncbi:unnamed protein product, partial [Rangifer tarandus platyrhynchus]